MERSRAAAIVVLLLALRLPGHQLPADLQKLIEVKQQARVLLSDVPNYSCLETVDRSWQTSENVVPDRDVLHIQVSVERGRESFAAAGSKSLATGNLAMLSERGLTATGLFSMFAADLFTTSSAAIYGAESGDHLLRYDFHVPSASSRWRLARGGVAGQVGERGFFTVDAHSLRLLNMEVNADEIPPSLPFLSVRVSIDYSAGTISGIATLIPSSAEMWTKERSGELHHDRFFFSQCRKFSAASTIYFEGSEAGPMADQDSQNLSVLPGGLTIPIELLAGVDSTKAEPGDAIRAAVTRDVLWKGKLLIKKGAHVEGHVRAVGHKSGPNVDGVVMEFDQVVTEAGSADFLAQFQSGYLREGANQAVRPFGDKANAPPGSQVYFVDGDVPGVISLVKFGDSCLLPAGMRMEWKVQDLRQVRGVTNSGDRSPLGTDPRFFGRGSPLYPY